MALDPFHIVEIIISSLIAIITIYLIALFIKSEVFKSYSCFNIMLMSIILFLDCVILALYVSVGENSSDGAKFIIILLKTFFDKMILSVLSLQVIIVYAGIIHTDYYYSHEKSFVKIGNAICAIVSGALAAVYSSIRWVKDDGGNLKFEFYLDFELTKENKKRALVARIIEAIFCGVNFFVNVFFLIIVILHISRKRKEAKVGLIQDLGYGNQLLRFSLIFSVNIIACVFSGVVVNFAVNFNMTEGYYRFCLIFFLVICFLIQLCFTINKTVYRETIKIFCKKKYKEIDDDSKIKSISTFEIAPADDDEDDN